MEQPRPRFVPGPRDDLREVLTAIALGLAACGQGRKVRFFRVTELITLLMEAREEKQLLRFRKQIKQLDLLIL
jgi:DNA replication protein DnaC